jgi:U3 small nucleolar RNA-associated protein 7
MDSQVKVWDVRTYKPVHAYFSYSPATSLDISQRGLLMVGYGRKVQVSTSAYLADVLKGTAAG